MLAHWKFKKCVYPYCFMNKRTICLKCWILRTMPLRTEYSIKRAEYCVRFEGLHPHIKNNKKIRVGGGGNIWTQNTLILYKKKKERIDRDGIRTHNLQVKKPVLLSTRLKHYGSNYKIWVRKLKYLNGNYELFKKNHMIFYEIFTR